MGLLDNKKHLIILIPLFLFMVLSLTLFDTYWGCCSRLVSYVDNAYGMEDSALHTMDALHVACALEWQADLFLTSDNRQLAAATNAGLRAEYIGNQSVELPPAVRGFSYKFRQARHASWPWLTCLACDIKKRSNDIP